MKRDECNPGDLVKDRRGKSWVIAHYSSWSGQYVWGIPATKSGKADKRYEGHSLDPESLTVIRRAHSWSGAGYVCSACGVIKDTGVDEEECCPKRAKNTDAKD